MLEVMEPVLVLIEDLLLLILPELVAMPVVLTPIVEMLLLMAATTEVRLTVEPPPLPAAVEMVWIPAELVAMPVLAEVETV